MNITDTIPLLVLITNTVIFRNLRYWCGNFQKDYFNDSYGTFAYGCYVWVGFIGMKLISFIVEG